MPSECEDMKIDFMIAGAQKAGTTALANYLRQHLSYIYRYERNYTSSTMKSKIGLTQISKHYIKNFKMHTLDNYGEMQHR